MQPSVKTLAPVFLGAGKVHYAQGIQAGPWVFATGHMAQNYRDGVCPDVLAAEMPYTGLPKNQKEADLVFDHIESVLSAAGSGLKHVARLDQYYPRPEAVDPYHIVRRRRLTGGVPASTSILVKELLLPNAEMDVQCIAVRPESGLRVEHFSDTRFQGHPSSAFSAAVRAGDFVFVPGVVASALPGEPHRNGMSTEALVVEGSLWKGCPIALEVEFCLKRKIAPSLALAGSSLANVVKAQVYLTHFEDLAPFLFTWNKAFADDPPALTVIFIPEPGFATYSARTEINVIALVDNARTKKQKITADVPTVLAGAPAAVRAGELLFLSGLYGVDANGLAAEARVDPRQPFFGSRIRGQTDAIMTNAKKICAAAGTSLENMVRMQQFHTDISEFYEAHLTCREHLPDQPLPFSAVEVAPKMPVPGSTLMMDLWVYVPGGP
jgi:enamine deaminase RidA (YjgF/YER057c/UK114 family)